MKILKPLQVALESLDIPLLNLKGKWSDSGFIDFIKTEEMSNPIMKGEDIFGRPFVAVKVKTKNLKTLEEMEVVGTFFQRFDNDFHTWAYASFYDPTLIYFNQRVFSYHYDHLQQRFEALVQGRVLRSFDGHDKEIKDFVAGNGDVEVWLSLTDLFPIAEAITTFSSEIEDLSGSSFSSTVRLIGFNVVKNT